MTRYFTQISYNGTDYHGWQIQNNAVTLQQTIEKCLRLLLSKTTAIIGCGRTDTGVHAQQYFFHFDSFTRFDEQKIVYQLNSILPESIAVQNIKAVHPSAHARFDATLRAYQYKVETHKNPFNNKMAFYYKQQLNINLMNEGAQIIKKQLDFSSFAKKGSDNKTNLCNIEHIEWSREGNVVTFEIRADRFLRNMVRAIVGTLIEVSENKISLEELQKIIESKNRSRAGFSVPAHGLYLTQVNYPKTIFSNVE